MRRLTRECDSIQPHPGRSAYGSDVTPGDRRTIATVIGCLPVICGMSLFCAWLGAGKRGAPAGPVLVSAGAVCAALVLVGYWRSGRLVVTDPVAIRSARQRLRAARWSIIWLTMAPALILAREEGAFAALACVALSGFTAGFAALLMVNLAVPDRRDALLRRYAARRRARAGSQP